MIFLSFGISLDSVSWKQLFEIKEKKEMNVHALQKDLSAITVLLLKLDTYLIDNYSANMYLREIFYHIAKGFVGL